MQREGRHFFDGVREAVLVVDEDDEKGSQTVDPFVVWAVWRARKEQGRPTPSAWVVLGILLGVPALLVAFVVFAVIAR